MSNQNHPTGLKRPVYSEINLISTPSSVLKRKESKDNHEDNFELDPPEDRENDREAKSTNQVNSPDPNNGDKDDNNISHITNLDGLNENEDDNAAILSLINNDSHCPQQDKEKSELEYDENIHNKNASTQEKTVKINPKIIEQKESFKLEDTNKTKLEDSKSSTVTNPIKTKKVVKQVLKMLDFSSGEEDNSEEEDEVDCLEDCPNNAIMNNGINSFNFNPFNLNSSTASINYDQENSDLNTSINNMIRTLEEQNSFNTINLDNSYHDTSVNNIPLVNKDIAFKKGSFKQSHGFNRFGKFNNLNVMAGNYFPKTSFLRNTQNTNSRSSFHMNNSNSFQDDDNMLSCSGMGNNPYFANNPYINCIPSKESFSNKNTMELNTYYKNLSQNYSNKIFCNSNNKISLFSNTPNPNNINMHSYGLNNSYISDTPQDEIRKKSFKNSSTNNTSFLDISLNNSYAKAFCCEEKEEDKEKQVIQNYDYKFLKSVIESSPQDIKKILPYLISNFVLLCYDPFSNYIIQRTLVLCDQGDFEKLVDELIQNFKNICVHKNGTRIIQNLLVEETHEYCLERLEKCIISNMDLLCKDYNGIHIVVKYITLQRESSQNIFNYILDNLENLGKDSQGCCMIQKIISLTSDISHKVKFSLFFIAKTC